MEDYHLLIDLHKNQNRQGPGGEAETALALQLAGIDQAMPLKIADLGCGTGASTLQLVGLLNAQITAVDFLEDFLDTLMVRAQHRGLANKITPLVCSIDCLPFADQDYDLIWSEGAIYTIGFAHGVQAWNRYLKRGGILVVSEITWTTGSRPTELQDYWEREYPEIDVASAKIGVLEQSGYAPIGYFVLPESCWMTHYYQPLQESFSEFLTRNGNSAEAQALVEAEKQEIELYKRYQQYYSYGVYIARKWD